MLFVAKFLRIMRKERGCQFLRSIALLVSKGSLFFLLATVLLTLLLRWIPPPTTSFMIQHALVAWWKDQKDYKPYYRWVNWDKISPYAALAVIATEDQKFPKHAGFDHESIAEARAEHRKGRPLRGASTISQQVAKNLFLWPGKSLLRKGVEAYFTVLIELLWSKQRILEVYLNVAEFGNGIFGVAVASERFFGKLPTHLQSEEAALLAAVLPNPLKFHVNRPSAYVRKRCTWILAQMRLLGGVVYLNEL